jgi:hypothetical protein
MHEVGACWGGVFVGIGIGIVIGVAGIIFISMLINLVGYGNTPRPDKRTERFVGGGR